MSNTSINETYIIEGIGDGVDFSAGTIYANYILANTISATTYQNLPLDIRVTGGTYSNGISTFTNNTGGTFSVAGFYTGYTLTSSAITSTLGYTPLSAYTDTFVSGGTYSNGTAIFANNTGGTFSLTGFSTGSTTPQNLQQVTDVGNVTTKDIIINSDNIGTAKGFRVNNGLDSSFANLTSGELTVISSSGTTSLYANGVLTLGDLNLDPNNPVNLSVVNDTTNYGVGFVLNSSAVLNDISLIYHPNYFIPQVAFNSPSIFYIPYKPEGIYTLATIDDIPTSTSQLTNNGSDGVNPFITAAEISGQTLQQVLDTGNSAIDNGIFLTNSSNDNAVSIETNVGFGTYNSTIGSVLRVNGLDVNSSTNTDFSRFTLGQITDRKDGFGIDITYDGVRTANNSILIPAKTGTILLDTDLTGFTNNYLPLSGGTMYSGASIFFNNNSKISEGLTDSQTGGNKGIALTCAVGYEWKFEAGEAYLTDITNGTIRLKQYALSIPFPTDDSSKGFVNGSLWYQDQQTLYYYICTDATIGAAIWEQKYPEINLQQVTDIGASTTNDITVNSINGSTSSFLFSDQIASINNDNNTYAYISNEGKLVINSNANYLEGNVKSDNLTVGNVTLQFPDKVDGSYTIATIDDISGSTQGITSINTLTASTQTFATGSTGTDFNIVSSGSTHTFNLPTASASNRGVLSSTDWSRFNEIDLTRKLIVSNTGSSVTGTVAETIIASMVVSANTLDAVCDLFITFDYNKNSANAIPIKLYYNTSNSLAGATQISLYTAGSNRNGGFNRKFVVKGTSMDLITTVPATNQLNNQFVDAIFGASTVITIAPTGNMFFIFTVANDAVGTTFTNKRATIEKMKLI